MLQEGNRTEASMRTGSAAKALAGALAVMGMLALSSPGVRVARAGGGDAASSEVSPAPLPEASAASRVERGAAPLPKGSATPEAIAEKLRAEMESSGEKPVVLNGRGYNYVTPRDPLRELGMVRSEAARQRGESPASR